MFRNNYRIEAEPEGKKEEGWDKSRQIIRFLFTIFMLSVQMIRVQVYNPHLNFYIFHVSVIIL